MGEKSAFRLQPSELFKYKIIFSGIEKDFYERGFIFIHVCNLFFCNLTCLAQILRGISVTLCNCCTIQIKGRILPICIITDLCHPQKQQVDSRCKGVLLSGANRLKPHWLLLCFPSLYKQYPLLPSLLFSPTFPTFPRTGKDTGCIIYANQLAGMDFVHVNETRYF